MQDHANSAIGKPRDSSFLMPNSQRNSNGVSSIGGAK